MVRVPFVCLVKHKMVRQLDLTSRLVYWQSLSLSWNCRAFCFKMNNKLSKGN